MHAVSCKTPPTEVYQNNSAYLDTSSLTGGSRFMISVSPSGEECEDWLSDKQSARSTGMTAIRWLAAYLIHGQICPDAFHNKGERSSGEEVPDEAQQGPERCPQTRLQHDGQSLHRSPSLLAPFSPPFTSSGRIWAIHIYFSLVTLCAAG